MKKVLLATAAVMLIVAASPANASWVLIPGDTTDRNLHGCGSSWEICKQRNAARNNARANPTPRPTQTSAVPKFCYDLATGKFTHWGPCRRVRLPDGSYYKVAH